MKGKELKNNIDTIELLDGKHKVAMDFNTFEALENIYGDMDTAMKKITGKMKFADIKILICASVNSCIENIEEHYTPYEIGKVLDISKLGDYVTTIMPLFQNSMPQTKSEANEEEEEKN